MVRRSPDKTYTNQFTYDWYGRLQTRKYPSGFEISYAYTDGGELEEISAAGQTLWSCSDKNALGQTTSYTQGSYNTSVTYDAYGRLTRLLTGTVVDLRYTYDDAGNIASREDYLTGQKEVFDYDDLNRLTTIDYYLNNVHTTSGDMDVSYSGCGNITSKTDVGSDINYGEGAAGPHALTSVEAPEVTFQPPPQVITYTSFNKVETIQDTVGQDTTLNLTISYGLSNQRAKTVQTRNATVERIRYYDGDYEEESTAAGTKRYHYIHSPSGLIGIFVQEGSADTMYHVLSDHLGSLTGIINEETDEVTNYSYNAWGELRDPEDWTAAFDGELIAGRGYTGHEHLMEYNLINMNGRVYDPVLARFLSPDPFVQFPGYANSYNRYSYVLNNPLKYIDPTGYSAELDQWVNDVLNNDSKYPYGATWSHGSGRPLSQAEAIGLAQLNSSYTPIYEFIVGTSGGGSGRRLAQFYGFDSYFFDYELKTGLFYVPGTDLVINPVDVLTGKINWYEKSIIEFELDNLSAEGADIPYENTTPNDPPFPPDNTLETFFIPLPAISRTIKLARVFSNTAKRIIAPKGWIKQASKKGGGTVFKDPKNPNNIIRQMPGNPKSPNPAQQNPYIKFMKDGKFYDVNGKPLPNGIVPEAHIPLEQFNISNMPNF